MIFEKGKDYVLAITRITPGVEGRLIQDGLEYVYIHKYESIDHDRWVLNIVVNSNVRYKIEVRGIRMAEYIKSLLKVEFRDDKIEKILD
jgi:hypothetical protein